MKAEEIRKKAVGKHIDGKYVCNIEVRKDGDIWFLYSESDGYHVLAQWKYMTEEERKFITQ